MGKVLTESEVRTIGGTSNTIDSNRCCTRARAEALNCTVTDPSNAANNQLVCGVSKKYVFTVPSSSKYKSSSSQTYTITSTKDGAAFYGVDVYAKSNTIRSATIHPSANNTTAMVTVMFNSGGYTSGWVTLKQRESGFVATTNINP